MSYQPQTTTFATEITQTEQPQKVSCPQCGKQLARQYDLTRHMKIHASNKEELMFQCPIEGCNHATLQKGNLATHMRRHSGWKNQICREEGCDFASCDPAALTRHRKTVHGHIPLRRAARDKAVPTRSSTTRYQPYRRVIQTKELKPELLLKQGLITKDMLPVAPTPTTSESGSTSSPEASAAWAPTPLTSFGSPVPSDYTVSSLSASAPSTPEPSSTPTYTAALDNTTLNGIFGLTAAPISFPEFDSAPVQSISQSQCAADGWNLDAFSSMLTSMGVPEFTESLPIPAPVASSSTSTFLPNPIFSAPEMGMPTLHPASWSPKLEAGSAWNDMSLFPPSPPSSDFSNSPSPEPIPTTFAPGSEMLYAFVDADVNAYSMGFPAYV
ncbi:hypothetical protein EIP91_009766 [Steccherinum ochraceum]|uniref:C2H2-type domain-containing protein n=1 Tax=Steccherinum ochraceum TaxID=92696 RepID=A0A4R0R187_9APHY|nr:hypothetical protein EIP91_009766 [Steccherinum ochraceum]